MFHELFDKAHAAGIAAMNAAKPVPMGVVEADVFGKPLPGAKVEIVEGGPCGFAWVKFPGNVPFGRWMKKQGLASKSYPNGLCYWVSYGGQSMARKEAFADAFAKVLQDAGIERVYSQSRMD